MGKTSKINDPDSRIGDRAAFWLAAGLLILALLLGGGSRGDILSLSLLRPAAVLVTGAALLTLSSAVATAHRVLLLFMAVIIVFVMVQLLPLPPAVWHALPGRDIVETIDRATGLDGGWRPFSMVPTGTWNALWSLVVPLAMLLTGMQLANRDLRLLAYVIVAAGLISALLSVLQILGPVHGPLYLYRITSDGAAVGLFANRNHNALFFACQFPLLALIARERADERQYAVRRWVCLAIGIALLPMLLTTGSRSGLVLGLASALLAIFVYHAGSVARETRRIDRRLLAVIAVVVVAALLVAVALGPNAEAVRRLFAAGQDKDPRFLVWGPIAGMSWNYFPFGSGIGSFEEVYQHNEPKALLGPTFLNHAHNDLLELWMTGGAAGVALIVIAVIWYARATATTWSVWPRYRESVITGRAASIVLLLLALGSLVDYPLRVPSLACVAVVVILWLHRSAAGEVDPTHWVSNWKRRGRVPEIYKDG